LTLFAGAVSMPACGGGGSSEEIQAAPAPAPAPAPTPAPTPAPSPSPSGSQDFAARCAQAGVVKCVGFDEVVDFDTGRASNFNSGFEPDSNGSFAQITRDTSNRASGNSSLRFTIPSNSAANSSGSYYTNFSKDLSVQFDSGQEFYVQWRQRFSPEFVNTAYAGGGGAKQVIVGTGDQPAKTYSSCSDLELEVGNFNQKGFPIMYNSCSGSASHPAYDGFYEPFGAYDFKLQNGRPAPYCLYSQSSSGYFAPNGNCFGYVANEWMTFQMRVQIGTRVGDEFKNSYVTLWGAREGKPSELIIQWGPYNLTASDPATNQRFGKIWLLPYNTGKSSSTAYPVAYTWYDELIISRNKIADPN
jgi:hypothetical protein